MRCFLYFFCLIFSLSLSAQSLRVEPPNWWVGMQEPTLELMVYGENVGSATVTSDHTALRIDRTKTADSPNYLFVQCTVGTEAPAGPVTLTFTYPDGGTRTHRYALLPRERPATDYDGFDAEDVICLITPDRFANGDPGNDVVAGMRETTVDRSAGFARHGGDLAGIIDHLDYLEGMGYTALWPTPLLVNDMPKWSYHGYAITDYYRVDPRFGSLADYRRLADELRARGMKLIMDQVANHCGSEHWWMSDLPFANWLNHQQAPQLTNHRRTVNVDPYAAAIDRDNLTEGWFVPTMPDLNQRNPHMASYLIQNSLWWIETLGLGGIRQDTYPYPDKDFLSRWTCRIMAEYPNFNIVGEEWSYDPNLLAYWQRGNDNKDGYESCLPSVMDFPIQRALVAALTEEESWDKGLIKLYETLSRDGIYPDPSKLMIMIDNHDMDRMTTALGGDTALVKMAHTYLATMRGIPQFYYGGEVLIQNDSLPGDHGLIRTDMPGGWAGDRTSAFTGAGLDDRARSVQTHLRDLLNWRKQHPVIATGRTIHYAPEDGLYVVGRYDERERIMVVYNKNEGVMDLPLHRLSELIGPARRLRRVDNGEVTELYPAERAAASIAGRSAAVYELLP